jgi:hypothetical protein
MGARLMTKSVGRRVCISCWLKATARRGGPLLFCLTGQRSLREAAPSSTGRRVRPPIAENLIEAKDIERRANEIIGPHVRRLAFAELLPSHAHLVKQALFYKASGWRRLAGNMMWPVSWRAMMRLYDLGPGAAAESRARLETELDWLDGKLADGRAYLAGDRFSRADLTVASLLANFAEPKEMPLHHGMKGPDALAADVKCWSDRPTMRWVRGQYRAYRNSAAPLAVGA